MGCKAASQCCNHACKLLLLLQGLLRALLVKLQEMLKLKLLLLLLLGSLHLLRLLHLLLLLLWV